MFKAIYLTREGEQFQARVAELDESALPEGTVTVRIDYSTINYKDALAIADRAPIVRRWPMVAGIDGAGLVESSTHAAWKAGERVVLTGWGVGEKHWGCLAQRARLDGDWLVRLPEGLTSRQAMAIGTAGFTAMLCALALEEQGLDKDRGDVLVTGASGGVGSIAVAILSGWGYRVVASTGKTDQAGYLKALGAAEVIDRAELSKPGKPLQVERWAGVVDSVGSHTLANACAQARRRGVIAACGLAQGMDFPASVAPFILRGVRLVGIDSVMCPRPEREEAWRRLAADLDRGKLESMTSECSLAEAIARAPDVLAAKGRGRLVVDVNR